MRSDCIDHGYRPGHNAYSQKRMPDRTLAGRHRLAYAQAHGLDEKAMGGDIMHSCDNRRCINPDHLTLGTKGLNNKDRAAKGRSADGEDHPRAVLTESDVIYLRRVYVKGHKLYGASALARQLGVSKATAQGAINGRYWAHVTEESPK